MAKDSTTFTLEDLERNPETVMKLTDCVTCSKHHGQDVQYFCRDHENPCCYICIVENHKTCSKVIPLKDELPVLVCNIKPDEILRDMKKIEIHFMKFIEMNESCVDILRIQINEMTTQLREIRTNINVTLNELENHLEADGSRVYKEVAIKKQYQKNSVMMLNHSVRSCQDLFDTVYMCGSNLQKYLIAEKVRSQFRYFRSLVAEKYEKSDSINVHLEISPKLMSMLSFCMFDFVKIERIPGFTILPLKSFQRQTQICQVDAVDVIDLKAPTGDAPRYTGITFLPVPRYTGITFLPGDKLMLADHYYKQCILLSSNYQFIASHALTDVPWNVCVLDNQEVAVSLIHQNSIQILSVVDDVIRPVRLMPTKYSCNGIAAAGKGEMVVNWYCGNNKSEWSLINTVGEVKCSYQYECPFSTYDIYHYSVALNNAKTRVYISADNMDSLLCFDAGGKTVYTYGPANLAYPKGVAVDKFDNIYVIGQSSNNIHQLSPNGTVLQVITSGVPICPSAICINKSKDLLVITNFINKTKLYIYHLT